MESISSYTPQTTSYFVTAGDVCALLCTVSWSEKLLPEIEEKHVSAHKLKPHNDSTLSIASTDLPRTTQQQLHF